MLLVEEETCLDCKRATILVIDYSSGDTICSECGLILEAHNIQFCEEWRTFASDDNGNDRDPNRVGAPTNHLLKSGDLATVIEKPKQNATSFVSKEDISTLFRAQNQVKNHEEDQIKKAFKETERITEALDLGIVIKSRACEILSKFDGHANTKLLRQGKKLNALCAASVSTACRELNLSRTLKEISMAANGVSLKDIRKQSMVIKHLLESEQSSHASTINTGELVRRFCSKLGLGQREIKAIREAVEKSDNFVIRRNPKSILASVIFMISHISQTNKRPIREIAIVSEVVENTIKNSVKDIFPYASKIIPNWFAREEDVIKKVGDIVASWDSTKLSV